MPIFEYECEKCKKITEKYVMTNYENEYTICNGCGNKAKKIISNSTFVLKGGGWFAEGYSKEKK